MVCCVFGPQRSAGMTENSFLRKFEEAKRRIEKTMEWRREFKPDLIPPEEVCSRTKFRISFALSDRGAGSN